jgi:SAM-dependent methyltransferase
MHLIHRKTCRACQSSALTEIIDIGDQYLQGSFVKPGKELPPSRKISTRLVRCDPTRDERACGLLQMAHSVPPEILYSAYWYRSGTNSTMRDHLRSIVEQVLSFTGISSGKVLDIGCNDGTLLQAYPSSFECYGIDPSDIAQQVEGPYRIIRDLFPSEELANELKGQPVDIVTSIAMFYDLEDPVEFVRAIRQILAPHGVWVFEMSYMPLMLKMTSYDTICHEHLEYYSLAVIEYILRKADMRLVDAELNDINGGSIRCIATHSKNFRYKSEESARRIANLRQEEFDLELDTDKPYRNFQDRINVHKDELSGLLKSLRREGRRIHIYGASTKGNTILQWCDIDHRMIDYAAERNPEKYGAVTLGTEIPIISEQESRALRPDYYLVLPWHFKKEFLEREAETIRSGIRFIFPLPTVEVIGPESLNAWRDYPSSLVGFAPSRSL